MRNMKKFMALMLAATMTVTMVPATAFAADAVVGTRDANGNLDDSNYTNVQKDEVNKWTVAAKATAKAVEDAGFASDIKGKDLVTNLRKAALKEGLSVDFPVDEDGNPYPGCIVIDWPKDPINPTTGATNHATFHVVGYVHNLLDSQKDAKLTGGVDPTTGVKQTGGIDPATGLWQPEEDKMEQLNWDERKVVFTMTANNLTDLEKAHVIEAVAKRAVNNTTTFTNTSTTVDLINAIETGLDANPDSKGVKVDDLTRFQVSESGSHNGEDGFLEGDVTLSYTTKVDKEVAESSDEYQKAKKSAEEDKEKGTYTKDNDALAKYVLDQDYTKAMEELTGKKENYYRIKVSTAADGSDVYAKTDSAKIKFSLISGAAENGDRVPLKDTDTLVYEDPDENVAYSLRETNTVKNNMINDYHAAYARIPYDAFTVPASDGTVAQYLQGLTFYSDEYYKTYQKTSLVEAIEQALNRPGSPLYLDNHAIAAKVQYTKVKPSHDQDGYVRVLVAVGENKGNKSGQTPTVVAWEDLTTANCAVYPIDLVIKHSPEATKTEVATADSNVLNAFKSDSTSIQPYLATTAASKGAIKDAITAAIKAELAKAPSGMTKPISNDLDATAPFEVTITSYTAPTFSHAGSVTYKVTYSFPKVTGYDKTFTVNTSVDHTFKLAKLKGVYSDSISANDIVLRAGVTKTLNFQFSSADVTDKVVSVVYDDDAVNEVYANKNSATASDESDHIKDNARIIDLKATGELYRPNYIDGLKTIYLPQYADKFSSADWSDTWQITAKEEGTTVLRVAYVNELTKKAYTTTFKVTVVRGFTDVADEGAYYYKSVYQLNENGILYGINDTEFAPSKNVTRAQFVSFLYRLALDRAHRQHDEVNYRELLNIGTSTPFSDVSSSAYYAKAVAWASKKGITSGKTATTFDPNGTVTRAEAVKFMYNYAGKESVYNATSTFSDVAAGKFFTEAVDWAVAKKLTAGKTATTFAPYDAVTRGQAATFIYRMFEGDNLTYGNAVVAPDPSVPQPHA